MPIAPRPAAPSSQTHQGIGARFFRRLGGAVRGAIAGIARAATRRRPATTPPRPQAARNIETPAATRQARPPRRPSAAKPAQPGWIARRLGLGRQRSRRPRLPSLGNAPFTPETCPGLTLQDCAFLNTPVEDCDPEVLRPLLSALAQHIAAALPPELGMSDPQAVFATLWGRLGCETTPAPAPPEHPDPAPPPSAEADVPAAPDSVASALQHSPDRTVPSHRRRPPPRNRRQRVRGCRALLRRAAQRPPMRRLCYAACAGPP